MANVKTQLMTEGLKALKMYNTASVAALALSGIAIIGTIIPAISHAAAYKKAIKEAAKDGDTADCATEEEQPPQDPADESKEK